MSLPTIYPPEFLHRMETLLGEEYPAFINSLSESSPTSMRLNPKKRISKFDAEEKVVWCNDGHYLKERPSFTFDPLFHAGTYYVQEASSMFIEKIWRQINPDSVPVKVLDMCAAPGGKSTHLLSLMSDESLLVSNEVIPKRNKILCENIIKWGNANCIITQNKTEDFAALQNYFDIVLIDAPCSGEGLFRKDKDAIDEWSDRNVAQCSVRQKEILEHALQCLKPDGFLIYSTCTYEPTENDENIEYVLELGSSQVQLPAEIGGIAKTKYGLQFFPHKIKGEGFYISVVRKNSPMGFVSDKLEISNSKSQLQNKFHPSPIFEPFLESYEDFVESKRDNLVFALHKTIASDFLSLEKKLYIRNAGIFMGTIKGKDFLPSHDLALSNHIRKDLPSIELNYDDAITYLRCEAPKIKPAEKGWHVVKYQNMNLGWIKALDGRINNYFPKELRILKK